MRIENWSILIAQFSILIRMGPPLFRNENPAMRHPSSSDGDVVFRFFPAGRRRWRIGLGMPGTAVFIEEIVDPRARSLERTIRRGDVHLQQFELIGRLRALIHFDPDAWLLRNDFTLAVTGAAARAVS